MGEDYGGSGTRAKIKRSHGFVARAVIFCVGWYSGFEQLPPWWKDTPSYLVLDQLLYGKTYWGLQGLELGVSGRKLAFSAGRSKTPAVSSQDAPRSLPRALWSSLPFRQSRGLTFRVASSWDRMIFNQKISIWKHPFFFFLAPVLTYKRASPETWLVAPNVKLRPCTYSCLLYTSPSPRD